MENGNSPLLQTSTISEEINKKKVQRELFFSLAPIFLILLFWSIVNYGQLRIIGFPELIKRLTQAENPQNQDESDKDYTRRIVNAAASTNSLISVARSVCEFLAQPIWGVASDRIGRRITLCASLLCLAIGAFGLSLAANTNKMWIVWIMGIWMGMGDSVFTQTTAMIADVSEEGNVSKNMGVFGFAVGLGSFLGPLLWAAEIEFIDIWIVFFLMGVCFVLMIFMVPLLKYCIPSKRSTKQLNRVSSQTNEQDTVINNTTKIETQPDKQEKQQVNEKPSWENAIPLKSLITIAKHSELRLLALLAFCLFTSLESFYVLFYLFMSVFDNDSDYSSHFSTTFISAMVSVFGIVSALTQAVLPHAINFSDSSILISGLSFMTIGFVQLTFVTPDRPALVVIGVFSLALGVGLCQPSLFGWVSRTQEHHGSVMSALRGICIIAEICGQQLASLTFVSSGQFVGAPWTSSAILAILAIGVVIPLKKYQKSSAELKQLN
eukprot:c13607_g1_i1.p1 GENE.c13607_g1_i1~~c13607_g1_i1.p1  ORF type:complete len:493 (-),score=190.70 c13607_g1_i1:14-1492(-)